MISAATFLFAHRAGAEERFGDFGTATDYDATRPVYFPKGVNYWFWGMTDPKKFIVYETPKEYFWVTTPNKPGDYVGARLLSHFHQGFVRAKPIDAGETVSLVIRFKDNLLQPVSVWARTGGEWLKLGTMGGSYDHAWTSAVFSAPRSKLGTVDGDWEFRIAQGEFGDLIGFLPIDWVKVTTDDPYTAEPKAEGFWPALPSSKFRRIGKTMAMREDGTARFTAGVMVKGMRKGSWKEFAKAGVNHLDLQAWEFEWRRKWEQYGDDRFGDRVRFGFPDWNDACREARIGCSVQFFTDSRAYWIENQYHGEKEMLDVMEEVVGFNKKHPANELWFPVDEPDHEDATWGAPPEFVRQMALRIRRADPDTPIWINFQAWKPRIYELYRDTFDIASFDAYPLGGGRPITEIVDRMKDINEQLGDAEGRWAVVEAHDGEHFEKSKRQLTAEETLVQGYLALVHGAQGVIYFIDNQGRYIDPADMPGPWKGIKQFSTETTDRKNGLESFLIPTAEILDTMGKSGKIVSTSPAIHFTLRKRLDGVYALIAVNVSRSEIKEVTLYVQGLQEKTPIGALFEDRAFAAGDGKIVDDFPGYGRHVYLFRMEPAK
ncbi:MAG: hypothetical protein M5R36_13260 [Deltaproteobacteria bacterium]|nr:hypothetical protein [Deltaproteobacteria bacterium]